MENYVNINNDAQKHLQAYIEYCNITGDTGDKPMSEKEYEEFKKNMKSSAQHRLYVYWANSQGLECKVIGPANKCFCDHRYKEHNYLEYKLKKISCKNSNCKCPLFNYIPIYGSQDFKCNCKHSYTDHNPSTKKCIKCKCIGFMCSWACSCGEKYSSHHTTFETKEERIKKGKRVDDVSDSMPLSMGGITNFASLADGVDRYEYGINQNINEKAIGYKEKGMLTDGSGKMKNKGEEKFSESNELNALTLFNTPHIYASSFSNVKAIGYRKK